MRVVVARPDHGLHPPQLIPNDDHVRLLRLQARFSFLALSRLMYLDEHSALQFRKWEGLRDR